MKYIHDSALGSHGHLRSSRCLIDGRWTLKLSDVGFNWLRSCDEAIEEETYKSSLGTPTDHLMRLLSLLL